MLTNLDIFPILVSGWEVCKICEVEMLGQWPVHFKDMFEWRFFLVRERNKQSPAQVFSKHLYSFQVCSRTSDEGYLE